MVEVNRSAPFDLNSTLDDIEDLPGFGAWHPGAYKILLRMEQKEVEMGGAKKNCIEVKFTHQQTLEETAGALTHAKAGDQCSMLVDLSNNVALSNWKKQVLTPVAEKCFAGQKPSPAAMIAKTQEGEGLACIAVMGIREDKKNGKEYVDLKHLTVL